MLSVPHTHMHTLDMRKLFEMMSVSIILITVLDQGGCMHTSKLIKLYALSVCRSLYICYSSMKLLRILTFIPFSFQQAYTILIIKNVFSL